MSMRVLQLCAGALVLPLAIFLFLWIQAKGELGQKETELDAARKKLEVARKGGGGGNGTTAPKGKQGGGGHSDADWEKLSSDSASKSRRIEALDRDIARLTTENAELRMRLAEKADALGKSGPGDVQPPVPPPFAAPPPPDGPYASGADVPPGPPPLEPLDGPPGPPVPEDGEPEEGHGWGTSGENELDELASVLKLNPEQREEVKRIIMDGQQEFERALIAISQSGERDARAIERVGDEISKRTQERIDGILYPEQKEPFREIMRKKREPAGP